MFVEAVALAQDCVFPILSIAIQTDSRVTISRHGTGFFISQDGTFFSASHCFPVLDGNSKFVFAGNLPDHRQEPILEIKVLFRDEQQDLLVGKTNYSPKHALSFSIIDPRVGTAVCAIGYPLFDGDNASWQPDRVRQLALPSYVVGFANGIGDNGQIVDGLLLRDPIVPGMSGGPILNPNGEVVGIASQTAIPQTATFAAGDRQIKFEFGIAAKVSNVNIFLAAQPR